MNPSHPAFDPWRELGIAPDSNDEAIQRAYRKLVRRYPPELAPDRFARIQAAYETFRSPGRLLAEARDLTPAALERVFPLPALALGPEPEPPPPSGEAERLPWILVARRVLLGELLRRSREE